MQKCVCSYEDENGDTPVSENCLEYLIKILLSSSNERKNNSIAIKKY